MAGADLVRHQSFLQRALSERVDVLARYMLRVNAPLPERDRSAQTIGRDRFAAFVERVGQQLASGRPALLPEDER
ncbi:MAG TPA: hypothetical protein VFW35_08045 [Sphingomicrobium sp.]|nr:hypothetical protein [Sphingomicrobium sp.]